MTWSDTQWNGFCSMIEESYAGEFDDVARKIWRLHFDDVAPADAIGAVRADLREGHEFRSVGRIIATIERVRAIDAPAFDAAWPSILRALRSSSVVGVSRAGAPLFDEEVTANRIALSAGKVVAGWAVTYGLSRLRDEPVDDPEYSGAVLRRLRTSYSEMTEHVQDRDRLALAGPRSGMLKRFDPRLLEEGS